MTTNELTNKAELNLQETHLMRKLDEKVQLGVPAAIDTQFGEVTMRKNVVGGFTASICTAEHFDVVFGYAASDAFLKLANILRGGN